METNLEKGCAEKIVELTGFGRLHVNDILPDIKEATRQAYLQGIRDAKGEIPKEWSEVYKDEQEARWKRGYDSCREETLEAITRLEENV